MQKSTGIIRKLDELGRIVIPVEIRKKLGIEQKDPIEIYTEGRTIILKQYQPNCIFCGKKNELQEYKNKNICASCQKALLKMIEE